MGISIYLCDLITINQDLNPQKQQTKQQPQQRSSQDSGVGGADTRAESPAGMLSESDRNLLKKFRKKVDKFEHTLCPTCNESFPSIELRKGKCIRCHKENLPKRFTAENNMDPGEVLFMTTYEIGRAHV